MAGTVVGRRAWNGGRDSDGYRTWKLASLVLVGDGEGPATALQASGLPQPGDLWNIDNDTDVYAWCRPDADIKEHQPKEGDPNPYFVVTQTFSNKPASPNSRGQGCQDSQVENPLMEPVKTSGGLVKYTEEATKDRNGRPILTSSWEMIRGPQVEFDENRPNVRVEMNVASFAEVAYALSLANHLNSAPLWGFARRCVKLSNVTWDKKFWGSCLAYYTIVMEFDTNANTFDRDILDEGTKVLNGHWATEPTGVGTATNPLWVLDNMPNGDAPDPNNPAHFMRATDPAGNLIKIVLNGAGVPAEVVTTAGARYASIAPSTGADLLDSNYWLLVVGPLTPVAWNSETPFVTGNLVHYVFDTYIATEDNTGVFPGVGTDPTWVLLYTEPGTAPAGPLPDEGDYDAGTSYAKGVTVRDASAGQAGNIHVEKYPEANLLTLGIPTSL